MISSTTHGEKYVELSYYESIYLYFECWRHYVKLLFYAIGQATQKAIMCYERINVRHLHLVM